MTPELPDTDGDGIADVLEARVPAEGQTNMYLPDSDGDGLSDGVEDANQNGIHNEPGETDPRNRNSLYDNCEDGVYEIWGFRPTPWMDTDGDALPRGNDHPPDKSAKGWPAHGDPNDYDKDVDDDRFLDGYEGALLGLAAVSDPLTVPSMGDVDLNTYWDNADAQHILNFFSNRSLPEGIGSGDPDRNAMIDNADAQRSLNFFGRVDPLMPAE
jgi:hypothetical protein